MGRSKQDPIARFEDKYIKTDTCWLWVASKTRGGYGKFWNGQAFEDAHRFSYRLYVSTITRQNHILHSCDVRNCVNPKHLRQGTEVDNRRDAIIRGRWNPNVGTAPIIHRNKIHCKYGHPYDSENTYRTKYGRSCRTCHRIAERRRRTNA